MSSNHLIKPSIVSVSKQLSTLKLLQKSGACLNQISLRGNQTQVQQAETSAQFSSPTVLVKPQIKSVSKALDRYLKNVREHEKMMAKERAEFELGKRYLANIMGWDPTGITQDDIDRAIEYLFPSGLTDLKARPVMKPPEEILPKFHKIDFDQEGKPVNPLFFSLKPKFYGLLSEISRKTLFLVKYYDEQVAKGHKIDDEQLDLSGTMWMKDTDLQRKLGEKITPEMYAQLIIAFDYLSNLPLAAREKEFLMQYRVPAIVGSGSAVLFGPPIPDVVIDSETNRRMATVKTRAKKLYVEVTVRDAGTGKYTVDGHHYDIFRSIMARENLMAPIIATNLYGRIDIEAKVIDGNYGLSVVPRAIRHGASLCIAALFPETVDILRDLNMLTQDPRKRERSKVNQPGARAKWIWKRR